jgi:hypothetical protein
VTRRPSATGGVGVCSAHQRPKGGGGEDVNKAGLDTMKSRGSRGDEEVQDEEEAEQHPGRLTFKDILLPSRRTVLLPRTANPTPFSSPSPSTSAAAADLDLGEESPTRLGFGRSRGGFL